MGIYKLKVAQRGTIIVDGVGSLEQAQEYIESCNPVDEVNWSDFLEVMEGGIELQKISIPDSMIIREFAEKIEVSPAEIIKWLFLRGEIANFKSEISFEDMREFADKHGYICEKEGGKEYKDIITNHNIKNMIFHIDPIGFYDSMIDFPVMNIAEIPDYFKDKINHAVDQMISEFIENNNIIDTSKLMLEMDIRVQVNVTDENAVRQFVVIVLDSEHKYNHVTKRVVIKDDDCLFEFKKYYTKKLEALFFGDVKTIGGISNGK